MRIMHGGSEWESGVPLGSAATPLNPSGADPRHTRWQQVLQLLAVSWRDRAWRQPQALPAALEARDRRIVAARGRTSGRRPRNDKARSWRPPRLEVHPRLA